MVGGIAVRSGKMQGSQGWLVLKPLRLVGKEAGGVCPAIYPGKNQPPFPRLTRPHSLDTDIIGRRTALRLTIRDMEGRSNSLQRGTAWVIFHDLPPPTGTSVLKTSQISG